MRSLYPCLGRSRRFIATAAMSCAALVALSAAARANIVWSSKFSDEQAIGTNAGNSSISTSYGGTATLHTTVYSDNTGGTFDLDPYVNSSYVSFENDRLGNVLRHVEFSIDNDNNDPDDYVEFSINFDKAVQDLQFSLLDVDSGTWDDGVEVFYNGSNNARNNGAINVVTGAYNGIDNESYMHGWEGYGNNAADTETFGNIAFNFNDLKITSLTIRYFSTDDADRNPGGQVMGLTNLTFVEAVPEPHSVACMVVFGVLMLVIGTRQKKRRGPATISVSESRLLPSPARAITSPAGADSPIPTRVLCS